MPSEYTLDVTHPAARELGTGSVIGLRAAWADRLAEIASSGQIQYTTLVTGGFLDWGLWSGMLGFNAANRTARLYDRGQHSATGCTIEFIAEAVTAALQLPDEQVANKRVEVAEVEYTGQDILRTLEQETGEKWNVEYISTEEARKAGIQARVEGNMRAAYVNFVLALNFGGSGASQLLSGLNFGKELGINRQTLASIVRDVVKTPETQQC